MFLKELINNYITGLEEKIADLGVEVQSMKISPHVSFKEATSEFKLDDFDVNHDEINKLIDDRKSSQALKVCVFIVIMYTLIQENLKLFLCKLF